MNKTLLDTIAERVPELMFKKMKNGQVIRATLKNMEATEAFLNGKLYRIIIEEVDE